MVAGTATFWGCGCTNRIKLLTEDICFAKVAMWQLAIYKVQWPEVWLMPFFPVQGSFFFLLLRRVEWWGFALQGANMKRTGGLRVTHCVWQEILFTIDLTARTVPQQALLICPLSQHLPLCSFFVAFLPVPWGREGGTQLINAPPRLSESPMEESPRTMLLMALPFSACLQEITSSTYSNSASVTFKKDGKHAQQLSVFDNYLRIKR